MIAALADAAGIMTSARVRAAVPTPADSRDKRFGWCTDGLLGLIVTGTQ
jgi:hypothetical protein